MDILDMGPDFKASLARLRAYAENRDHWFYPALGHAAPGDNPAFVIRSGTLRIVFTWTVVERTGGKARVYRHLSISTTLQVPGHPPHPSQILCFTVAHLLGFSGAKLSGDIAVGHNPEWYIEVSSPDHASIPHVILAEPVSETAEAASPTSN